ncbi:hypothetical protein MUN78_11480 [Leucobacter allii]|uniref:Uncharacterized protein n=1 Tax=Leucobacter allii TaxID=2932247 RepID=A0ABY4FI13_9MICO|nr:hypothetical protein [Leucobacter allii]UOQ56304.1 hypothetical protein MUN78_11480 [Leucobacter allii]
MRTPHRGLVLATGWALLLAPPLAFLLKASVFPGWMMFILVLGAIPLLIGYAMQIVVASNGMLRSRGVFAVASDAWRGILAAWLTSAGVLLSAFFLVDGGDDGSYGSAFTELTGTSSTAEGERLSMGLLSPCALMWLAGWLWLVIEWIVQLGRARAERRASGA